MALVTYPFDAAATLDSAEAIEEYLIAAFEENDPGYITHALGTVARATKGMSALAADTGLTRAALYKALSGEGNPEFSTVLKVAGALGFRLHPERVAEPIPA